MAFILAVPPSSVEARRGISRVILAQEESFPQVKAGFSYLPTPTNKPLPKPRIGATRRNCVTVVKLAGYHVPRTKDGWARTIPMTSVKLPPENTVVVMKTAESWMGHVLVGKVVNGQIISVVDSEGAGRVIPTSVYRGYISS